MRDYADYANEVHEFEKNTYGLSNFPLKPGAVENHRPRESEKDSMRSKPKRGLSPLSLSFSLSLPGPTTANLNSR